MRAALKVSIAVLHHIHRPPPSTEIILRNLMLSFIRLPNHSVENVCKYPFSICFIHACSLCLFVRFNSVWQFCYSFACPSLSVDHHFVYGCKMRNKIRNILAHFFPLSHSSHWPCAQHYISFHKIFPFTTCFHLPFIVFHAIVVDASPAFISISLQWNHFYHFLSNYVRFYLFGMENLHETRS